MKRIPPIPPKGLSKPDDLVDRVVRCNPKVYAAKYDLVELEEWIQGKEKIFDVIEVPKEKKENIGMFYLTGEVGIWWSSVRNKR